MGAALIRHRLISATAGTAAAVIVAGCAYAAAATHNPAQAQAASAANASPAASTGPSAPAAPLRLLSVSPAGGLKHANGGAPVTLTFSSALSPSTPLPVLTPEIKGSWQVDGATATFTPASGFLPGTKVTVRIPGGSGGMTGAGSGTGPLAASDTVTFTTGSYSNERLQQILAQLGYLPLTWSADPGSAGSADTGLNAEVRDAYDPPAGRFTFKSGYPSELTGKWQAGQDNLVEDGAIRAFEYDQGLTMDGSAGPHVWAQLLTAASKNQVNPHGYTYALASQHYPETLKVWHNGKLILDSPANTGIAAASTVDGTFPVYERLQYQVMKGTNPDGSKYADPVYWVSYFNGGDAVHYFSRGSYGSYQSLGCVELPWTQAKFIWSYLTYGTLVTVTGPVG
jgi:peptidoglycan hydrolase-like protein with peptidoglycan-binding domain